MRSDRLAEKTKRAEAFKTDCSRTGRGRDTSENRVAVVHLADNQCTNQGVHCACIRITNVCFFSNVCMQVKLVNILTCVPILSYENGVTIP